MAEHTSTPWHLDGYHRGAIWGGVEMYVIRRTDQGGGWVARPGSRNSYTHKLQDARTYPTKESANADRCQQNEIVERVDTIMR